MRRLVLLACVTACHQQAAHLFPPGGGQCADPAGCEAPTTEGRFELPDEEHAMPPTETSKPEASCANVGFSVSSLTVGNYATAEERAPASAQGKARCEKLKLTADERECIVTAEDAATLTWCAPQMFELPTAAVVAPERCPEILRWSEAQVDGPPTPRQIGLRASCKLDRWTEAFASCVQASSDASSCLYVAPGPLQKKINDRIARAARP